MCRKYYQVTVIDNINSLCNKNNIKFAKISEHNLIKIIVIGKLNMKGIVYFYRSTKQCTNCFSVTECKH